MFKVFEFITEVIGWLQIATSPFLIGVGVGALVYFSNPSSTRLILGILIALTGLIVGIVWATKIWKKKGTIWFMSRVIAFPELSKASNEEDEIKSEEKKGSL